MRNQVAVPVGRIVIEDSVLIVALATTSLQMSFVVPIVSSARQVDIATKRSVQAYARFARSVAMDESAGRLRADSAQRGGRHPELVEQT